MIVTDYTTEDLKKLPLRAIVALAARCARRVEYLTLLPDGHPDLERCRTAIDGAIRLAEDFARGLPCRAADAVIREVQVCQASARAITCARRRWPRSYGPPMRRRPRSRPLACATSRRDPA